MRAMVLEAQRQPLVCKDLPEPQPDAGEVVIEVEACAVCRTDLHVYDADLVKPKLPLVLGHEIVGTVKSAGKSVQGLEPGQRVGVPWLGWTCGQCRYCRRGQENLCAKARFTGYQIDGGYAELTKADARFCFSLSHSQMDAPHAAPLLCAGLIGWRSLKAAGQRAENLGLYGFGAAAHVIAQVALYQGRRVFAFTRPDDDAGQKFARELGATWAGSSEVQPPEPLDAAIIFAPVGALVPLALKSVDRGGTVVCGGIHMSEIPSFPYELLWGERKLCSIANLTRQDGEEFFKVAEEAKIRTTITRYPLEKANQALDDLRNGDLNGAAVLVP
jgi:propanol-preferring alcohol dehydrogenase